MTSTATKIETSVPRRVCKIRDHHAPWPCPLHSCPDCAVEAFTYSDPEDYTPPVPREDPRWEFLAYDLAEAYVDSEGCAICAEILTRAGWAAFAGWECEATCTVAHCEVCHLCGRSGRVCRQCGLCLDHEDEFTASPCWRPVWSRARRREVDAFGHQLLDPATGRWSR